MKRPASEDRLRIGVSACLTGQAVRFDGSHCRDDFVDALGRAVELVPVCPEVEAGLGMPRETVRLVRREGGLALVAPRSGREVTDLLVAYAERKARELAALDLDGYIVKRGSPTCGMERVRIYADGKPPTRDGRGVFTSVLMRAFPLLVVEEEGRLRDSALRENFLVRLAVGRRIRRFFSSAWRRRDLVALHTSIKLELLAHSPADCAALGRLVAHVAEQPASETARDYAHGVMATLAKVPTRGRHVNALEHMAGYVSSSLSPDDRRELAELIGDYRAGREPRGTPLALLRHHARHQSVAYLAQQSYLDGSFRRSLEAGS